MAQQGLVNNWLTEGVLWNNWFSKTINNVTSEKICCVCLCESPAAVWSRYSQHPTQDSLLPCVSDSDSDPWVLQRLWWWQLAPNLHVYNLQEQVWIFALHPLKVEIIICTQENYESLRPLPSVVSTAVVSLRRGYSSLTNSVAIHH